MWIEKGRTWIETRAPIILALFTTYADTARMRIRLLCGYGPYVDTARMWIGKI